MTPPQDPPAARVPARLNRRQAVLAGSALAAGLGRPGEAPAQSPAPAPAPTPSPAPAGRQPPPFSDAALGTAVPAGWRHQTLPKVPRANQFEIVAEQGVNVLQVRSQASASSWLCPLVASPAAPLWLHWRWKVSRPVAGSDLRVKAGDDYAARLYVLFDLPLERLSLGDRLRLQAARVLSGAEVPAAALCYVWGQAQPAGSSGWNPYTDRVRMIVLDSGAALAQQWRSHARPIGQDWAEAFGGEMPPISGLAVSADTDNTGEQAEAWFGDLRWATHR